VLLNADPLHDIRNTTRIDSVIIRGRLIDADERRRMLVAVESAAQTPASGTARAATAPQVAGCLCHSAPRWAVRKPGPAGPPAAARSSFV
jgi:hypothetical protein